MSSSGPGSRYVEVSREKLVGFLNACGFSPRKSGKEVVYVRAHKHHADLFIKVYTSLPTSGGPARGKGQDAIRVTVAYESEIPFRGRTNFGIYKTTRTFRTGSEELVLERLYTRMQEAYVEAGDWLRKNWSSLKEAEKKSNRTARKAP